jgi:membrane associated rhomboid family serine protease
VDGHLRSLNQLGKEVFSLLRDFRATLILVVVVLGLGLAVQLAMEAGVVSLNQLSAARANPLGVFTSIFAHYDWSQLAANVEGLLFFAGAFMFTNIPLSSAERARRALWFASIAYPLAVVVNVVYVALAPGSSSGASGLVYAAFGIGFAFFLNNARDGGRSFFTLFRSAPSDAGGIRRLRHAFWWLGMNVALVAIFLYLILFDLPLLFGVGYSGINAFAHLLGFLLGFILTIAWSALRQAII